MTKRARKCNGGKEFVNKIVLGKLDSYMQQNQTGLLSQTVYKNKMDQRLKHKPEIIKLLEENIGSMFFDMDLNNIFFFFQKSIFFYLFIFLNFDIWQI